MIVPEKVGDDAIRTRPCEYRPWECYEERNHYGLPIVMPEYYEGEHRRAMSIPGIPPECSCGWTRWSPDGTWYYELAHHLRDMGGVGGYDLNAFGPVWADISDD